VSILPLEVTEAQITIVMSTYGDVKKAHDKVWAHVYRFEVKTDVRLVDIGRKKRIPSHIKLDGHRALVSYEGQPVTCSRGNEQGHQIHDCPRRKLPGSQQTSNDGNSRANMVKRGTEKVPSVINNGTNNVTISPNGEPRQISDLPLRSFDEDEQNKQGPMTVEYPDRRSSDASGDINKTGNIVRME